MQPHNDLAGVQQSSLELSTPSSSIYGSMSNRHAGEEMRSRAMQKGLRQGCSILVAVLISSRPLTEVFTKACYSVKRECFRLLASLFHIPHAALWKPHRSLDKACPLRKASLISAYTLKLKSESESGLWGQKWRDWRQEWTTQRLAWR